MSNENKNQSFLEQIEKNTISVAEASRISKMTPSYIRRLMRKGTIQGVKLGRDWFTTEEAIRGYLETERRPGPKST